jgi:large subunit ribosomal protein L21
MYAIVKVGGKQYRVEKGDSIVVDRLSAGEGDKVELEPLLLRPDGKDDPVFDADGLGKAKVEATVTRHERGPKVRVLKFKPKKGYKRRSGHRSELTRLEIADIKLAARRSAPKKEAEAEEPAKKAGTTRARKPAAGAAEKEKADDGS